MLHLDLYFERCGASEATGDPHSGRSNRYIDTTKKAGNDRLRQLVSRG
jgi:hypothetical protein